MSEEKIVGKEVSQIAAQQREILNNHIDRLTGITVHLSKIVGPVIDGQIGVKPVCEKPECEKLDFPEPLPFDGVAMKLEKVDDLITEIEHLVDRL